MEQEKGKNIADRLMSFAVGVISLAGELSDTYLGNHVSNQILRSSTSAGANYEESRGAESKADFPHKLGIVSKELKESRYWLKIINNAKLHNEKITTEALLNECEELCAIIGQSIITTRKRH